MMTSDFRNSGKQNIQFCFEGRTFFKNIMGEYRYMKSDGWAHTSDIAHNFKGVDFYKYFAEIDDVITEKTDISMKTTVEVLYKNNRCSMKDHQIKHYI